MILNLGLENAPLYAGCEIGEVGGRLTLLTPPAEAMNIIGRNATRIIEGCEDRASLTLTGPMAVWAYLVVFHAAVHRFGEIWYEDGRNARLLIARH